jgi:predicted metal-dependent peptidase
MKTFRTDAGGLKRVKLGKKPPEGGGPPPPKKKSKDKIIPEDDADDDGNEGDDESLVDIDKELGEPGDGEGGKSIPSVTTDKGDMPAPDVMPEGATIEDQFGTTALDGSDGTTGGKQGRPVMTREALKEALDQARKEEAQANEEERTGQAGTGIGGQRVGVSEKFPSKTDWATILINLLNKYKIAPPTFKNPHKRTFGMTHGGKPVVIPSRPKEKDIGKIIVAIDTSGSINDVILSGFLSELKRLFLVFGTSTTFAVKVVLWNYGPYADSPDFSAKQFNEFKNWVNTHFVGGGTEIDSVFGYITKNYGPEYVGVLWLTDGDVDSKATPPDAFNIFLINGFLTGLSTDFIKQMQKFSKTTILRTSYGEKQIN